MTAENKKTKTEAATEDFSSEINAPLWSVVYLTSAAPLLYGLAWPAQEFTINAVIYLPFVVILAIEFMSRLRHRASERSSHVSYVKP